MSHHGPRHEHDDRSIPEQLHATSGAVRAAHEGRLLAAIGSTGWERRGVLDRLRRLSG